MQTLLNFFRRPVWVIKVNLKQSITNISPVTGLHREYGDMGTILTKYIAQAHEYCEQHECNDWVRIFTLDDHSHCVLCGEDTMIILGKQQSRYISRILSVFSNPFREKLSDTRKAEARLWVETIVDIIGYGKII